MDNKRLIGTILGVMAFIALIAGATFAWLQAATNVVNNTIVGSARNLTFTYAGSMEATGLKQLSSGSGTIANIKKDSSSTVSTSGDGWVQVTASKPADSAGVGTFRLSLAFTQNTFYTNSIIYVVCKGTCPDVNLATVTHTTASRPVATATCTSNSAIVACGTLGYGSTTPVVLYNDNSTFTAIGAVSQTYQVAFWFDAGTVHNEDAGKKFVGHVYAEASQQTLTASQAIS